MNLQVGWEIPVVLNGSIPVLAVCCGWARGLCWSQLGSFLYLGYTVSLARGTPPGKLRQFCSAYVLSSGRLIWAFLMEKLEDKGRKKTLSGVLVYFYRLCWYHVCCPEWVDTAHYSARSMDTGEAEQWSWWYSSPSTTWSCSPPHALPIFLWFPV